MTNQENEYKWRATITKLTYSTFCQLLKMMYTILFAFILATTQSVRCQGETPDERREAVENGVIAIEHYVGTDRENETFTIWERLNELNVAGVVIAAVKDFEIDWVEGYGLAQPGVSMTADSVMQLASVSKFVTAMATLKLVQNGELDLDTNVNDYLTQWQVEENEFTETEKVTLRRLLSHTAGTTVAGFLGYPEGDEVPTLVEVLDGAPPANSGPVVVDYVPGSSERYSGGGTTVQQLVLTEYAENNAQQTFEEFLRDEVLIPAGMDSSSFEDRDRSNLDGVATAHICANNQASEIGGYWHTYPEKAAAGLYSTGSDIVSYMMDIARAYNGENDTVLTQEMVEEMLTVQLDGSAELFGLGPNVYDFPFLEDIWFGHGGSNQGYCNQALASTGGDGMVIMTNGDCGESQAQTLLFELMRTTNGVYGWIPEAVFDALIPARLQVELPSVSPQDYEGTYSVEGSVPDGSAFEDVYEITADSITPAVTDACSFRLWAAADSDLQYATDMFYYSSPQPRIEFVRGTFGEVIGMTVIQGDVTISYNRVETNRQ